MFKKFLLTSFLIFGSFLTILPSKKENTIFFVYCYSLEKIIYSNSVEKSKNPLRDGKLYLRDIASFGTNKSQGFLINKIIDQYKNSMKIKIVAFVPNQFYCLTGYWIETLNPGKLQSIIFEKSKQKINQYNNTLREVDAFIKDINLKYESIKKEINDSF